MGTLSAAMKAFPVLTKRKAAFEAWLEARVDRSEWAALNVEDLALVWLALEKDRAALAEVDRRVQRVATAQAGKHGDDFLAEVLQRVRQRLLVGASPKLAAYQGKGALVQYLKAVVLSVSVDLARANKVKAPEARESALMSVAAGDEGADHRLAHASHRAHFTAAFKEALQTLDAEERVWLRMRFVENLSVEAVGAAFGVHRTTALRRLEKAQKTLMTETRSRLGERLDLSSGELDSLLRAMRPSLAENLSRLFPKPKL